MIIEWCYLVDPSQAEDLPKNIRDIDDILKQYRQMTRFYNSAKKIQLLKPHLICFVVAILLGSPQKIPMMARSSKTTRMTFINANQMYNRLHFYTN